MSEEDRGFAAAREDAADRVLLKLRSLVRATTRTQRSLEIENGFRRGYLSQVLQGHITLTIRHLLGILKALDVPPSQFFAELEGRGDGGDQPLLLEIRERMARYDAAFEQLMERGLLQSPSTAENGPAENGPAENGPAENGPAENVPRTDESTTRHAGDNDTVARQARSTASRDDA